MDIGTVATTAAVTGGINLLIGGLLGGMVKRWIELRDKEVSALQSEVRILRDNRIAAIEDGLAAHAEDDKNRLAAIEREYVRADLCREQHRFLIESQQEFRGAVIELAHVQEQTKTLAAFISEVNQRQIALASDLARLQGRGDRKGG